MWFMRSAVRAWAASSAWLSTQSVPGGVACSWVVSSRVSSVGERSSRPASRAKERDQFGAVARSAAAGELLGVRVDQLSDVGRQHRVVEGGGGSAQEVDDGGGEDERGQRRLLVAAVRGEQRAALGSPGLSGRQCAERPLSGGEGDPVGQRCRQPQRLRAGARSGRRRGSGCSRRTAGSAARQYGRRSRRRRRLCR